MQLALAPADTRVEANSDSASQVRYTFCKKEETLAGAEERLSKLWP